MTYTYTMTKLEVSKETYNEIAGKLGAAGYEHAFKAEGIDMHGICLAQSDTAHAAVRFLLQPDLSGRSLSELLSAAADALDAQGDGPLVQCLRERAQAVASAEEGL